MKNYDYESLEYLRNRTKLNLKEKRILKNLKTSITEGYELLRQLEHSQMEIDYTKLYEYEYAIRYLKWQKTMLEPWKRFGDGLEFEEFCNRIMNQNIEKQKELKLKDRV